MNMLKKYRLALGLVILAVFGAACTDSQPESTKRDKETSSQILTDMQKAHPVPKFAHSQLRENLVDIITAQAESTQTTSFFFLEGVGLVSQCPSIGFPIASTAQLTAPDQQVGNREGGYTSIAQIEPTGVYTGESSGTYVICVDAKGEAYARYWEGYVQTVTGPAEWNGSEVVLTGSSSFDFNETNK